MKKIFLMFIAMVMVFSVFGFNNQASASMSVSAEEVDGPLKRADKVDKGKTFELTVETDEGVMVTVQDKATEEFISLKADFLNKKEEKEQLKLLNKMKIEEVSSVPGTTTDSFAQSSADLAVTPNSLVEAQRVEYNVWRNGPWKNYKITFEGKATATIVTTLILSYIPYVGRIAGAMAAVFITWNVKVGYFSARKDTMLLGGFEVKHREHLKAWRYSSYTGLRSYKIKSYITQGRG